MVMVNTMDLGRGFLKLQEDNNSRRSSSLFPHKPLELNENGLHYVTRINCGCGQCVPFRVKVEKDDGGLRIGKLTLAANCHLIIIIFGFFFLIAGSVLTALAYKQPVHDPDLPLHERASLEHVDSPSRQEGKVAGPIFIIVGSALVLMGFTLTALACKLNREAKRQLHLSRFTWETPPIQTPDIFNSSTTPSHHFQQSSEHFAPFANNLDTFSVRSRELSTCSANSNGVRRDSSFTFTRQQQHPPPPLSTIAQAVPVGIFLFGGGPESMTSPKSPTIQVTDPSGFQEIELSSPTADSAPASANVFSSGRSNSTTIPGAEAYKKQFRSHSDGASPEDISKAYNNGAINTKTLSPNDPTSQSKVNLALRPSLPIIPMFATSSSPHYFNRVVTPLDARNLYVSSRSDEPFGSIASLSTSGDIACFPITQSATTASFPASTPNGVIAGGISNNKRGDGGGGSDRAEEDLSTSHSPNQPGKKGSSSSNNGASISNQSPCGINTNIANNNEAINDASTSNKISSDREINRKNDANLNNGTHGSGRLITDVSSRRTNVIGTEREPDVSRSITGVGISELPPINVNDCDGRRQSGGGALAVDSSSSPGVNFRPKSILRQSKSEDWEEQRSEEGGRT